jgi:hypothetical protein
MTSILSRAIRKSVVLALPLFLGALLFFPTHVLAQGSSETQEGVNSGNYNIKQTFELGYRWEDVKGNRSTYNTFVNLNQGPRLFEHSLEMRSLNHQGLLFDNFSLHSFGYGGDPNDVTKLRAYKNKWYNFNATFRRDRNFWDYRLLANPLNPNSYVASVPAGTPIFDIPFSPHRMEITRRMSDYSLVIAPQNVIRGRLSYSRNVSEGPSLSSIHEGTDAFLLQNWKTTLNSYQVGIDIKLLPKTNVSFDQFFHFYKGDTTYTDPISTQLVLGDSALNRPLFQLSNGQAVDIGAIFNFNAGAPCSSTAAAPFITNAASTPLPTMKAACNGFLSYGRGGNVRTFYPTSQLGFQTSYFKNLDISGRLIYSNSNMDLLSSNALTGYQGAVNFNGSYEFLQGLLTRTQERQFAVSGPANAKRYSITGDYAMTWYVTDRLRFTDVFRYDRYRIPGNWNSLTMSLFPVNPAAPQPAVSLLDPTATFVRGTAPPATCPTATAVGCPRHASSSPADILSYLYGRLIKQRMLSNHVEVAYDVTRRFGGEIGYRLRHRRIDEGVSDSSDSIFFPTLPNRGGCTPGSAAAGFTATNLPDLSCRLVGGTSSSDSELIYEHAGLMGLWFRPTDLWRITYDMELFYADNTFTRISPRQRQRYKIRATYKPREWLSFGGHVNLLEQRNNVDQIFHRDHNRTYAFMVTAMKERWGFDLGYDYNDIDSKTNICFTQTSVPLPPGSGPCPVSSPAGTTFAISTYDNRLHFAYANVMWQPVKRLTTNFGYTVSSTTGNTLVLGPLNPPLGTLSYNWHKPYANVAIELEKHVVLKSGWNFYGYNEKQPADVYTSPVDSLGRLVGRDFHGNLFTTSVRFMF